MDKSPILKILDNDRVTLYHGDALAGMDGLADQSFDLAIADPPYGASTTAQWVLPAGHNLAGCVSSRARMAARKAFVAVRSGSMRS